MATLEKIKNRADTLIQDDSLTDMLEDLINEGVQEIAGGMQSTLGSWITPPLPVLLTIGNVDTDLSDPFVAMPDTFQRTLQFVASSSGYEIDIADTFIEFSETYPLLDRSGRISEVIEHGGNIYYQGIPTVSETLTLHFYRKPVDMTEDSHTPDGIPSHLQIPLLVNYAAWKAFEHIEDGLEGDTPNTQKYMGLFLNAMRTLELSVPDYTRGIFLR